MNLPSASLFPAPPAPRPHSGKLLQHFPWSKLVTCLDPWLKLNSETFEKKNTTWIFPNPTLRSPCGTTVIWMVMLLKLFHKTNNAYYHKHWALPADTVFRLANFTSRVATGDVETNGVLLFNCCIWVQFWCNGTWVFSFEHFIISIYLTAVVIHWVAYTLYNFQSRQMSVLFIIHKLSVLQLKRKRFCSVPDVLLLIQIFNLLYISWVLMTHGWVFQITSLNSSNIKIIAPYLPLIWGFCRWLKNLHTTPEISYAAAITMSHSHPFHLFCPSSLPKGFCYLTLYFRATSQHVWKASITMAMANVKCAVVLVIHCHLQQIHSLQLCSGTTAKVCQINHSLRQRNRQPWKSASSAGSEQMKKTSAAVLQRGWTWESCHTLNCASQVFHDCHNPYSHEQSEQSEASETLTSWNTVSIVSGWYITFVKLKDD